MVLVRKGHIKLMAKGKRSKRKILVHENWRQQLAKYGPWVDLPRDISRIIKSKLSLCDQVRFSAVCKGWRIFDKPPPIAMTYCPAPHGPDMNLGFELYGQCGERIHKAIYNLSYQNYWCYGDDNRKPKVCASKNGWLLAVDDFHLAGPVTLINPFSNTVLPCPKLGHQIALATFSGIPTSQNCVIFAFYSFWDKTHLGTYYMGSKYWHKFIVAERKEAPEPMSVVCTAGELYYVFRDGMLGCYNFTEQHLTTLCESFPQNYSLRNEKINFLHLVECEGQILLALENGPLEYMWHLFRFDKSQMAWIATKTLGGRALFASPTSFVVLTLGDETALADCICYFASNTAMVYSFKDEKKREHDCKPQKDFSWREEEEQPSNDIRRSKPYYSTIWIEPYNI